MCFCKSTYQEVFQIDCNSLSCTIIAHICELVFYSAFASRVRLGTKQVRVCFSVFEVALKLVLCEAFSSLDSCLNSRLICCHNLCTALFHFLTSLSLFLLSFFSYFSLNWNIL